MTKTQIDLPKEEKVCQKCKRPNPSWHAPNDLWNRVTGHPPGFIICPSCFQEMADKLGVTTHGVWDILAPVSPEQTMDEWLVMREKIRAEWRDADQLNIADWLEHRLVDARLALSQLELRHKEEMRELIDWLAVSGYLTGRETLPSLLAAFLKSREIGK